MAILLGLDGGTATLLSGVVVGLLGLAGVAWQRAGQAHKEATHATTTAADAASKATEAKVQAESAKETAKHAVPSDAMVAALLEVVRNLQDELRSERSARSELRSRYERLWRLLAEDYPDVLAAAGLEKPWPES